MSTTLRGCLISRSRFSYLLSPRGTGILLSVRLFSQNGPRPVNASPQEEPLQVGPSSPASWRHHSNSFGTLETKCAEFLCQTLDHLRGLTAVSGVPLVLRPTGSCSATPQSLRTETLVEAQTAELSLFSDFISSVVHFWSHEYGEVIGPPRRAPMLGKATIPLGGRLVSQRVLFETD